MAGLAALNKALWQSVVSYVVAFALLLPAAGFAQESESTGDGGEESGGVAQEKAADASGVALRDRMLPRYSSNDKAWHSEQLVAELYPVNGLRLETLAVKPRPLHMRVYEPALQVRGAVLLLGDPSAASDRWLDNVAFVEQLRADGWRVGALGLEELQPPIPERLWPVRVNSAAVSADQDGSDTADSEVSSDEQVSAVDTDDSEVDGNTDMVETPNPASIQERILLAPPVHEQRRILALDEQLPIQQRSSDIVQGAMSMLRNSANEPLVVVLFGRAVQLLGNASLQLSGDASIALVVVHPAAGELVMDKDLVRWIAGLTSPVLMIFEPGSRLMRAMRWARAGNQQLVGRQFSEVDQVQADMRNWLWQWHHGSPQAGAVARARLAK